MMLHFRASWLSSAGSIIESLDEAAFNREKFPPCSTSFSAPFDRKGNALVG